MTAVITTLDELLNQIVVNVVEYVWTYEGNSGVPDQGLEWMEYQRPGIDSGETRSLLEQKLGDESQYVVFPRPEFKLRTVSERSRKKWDSGSMPASIKQMERLYSLGLDLPITLGNMRRVNSLFMFTLLSGSLDYYKNLLISVPNSILSCVEVDNGLKEQGLKGITADMECLHESLKGLQGLYYQEGNTLRLKGGGACIGRMLQLLGMPVGRRATASYSIPEYLKVVAENIGRFPAGRIEPLQRLLKDTLYIWTLCVGQVIVPYSAVYLQMPTQLDADKARKVGDDACSIIRATMPEPQFGGISVHYNMQSKSSQHRESEGETLYFPRITITGGAYALRAMYPKDRALCSVLDDKRGRNHGEIQG